MTRINAAASIAGAAGLTFLIVVGLVRFVDWLFQGQWFLYLALLLTILVTFTVVVLLEIATDDEGPADT